MEMTNFERTETGFLIRIPLRLYARPAVIKALYAYREKYLICYELKESDLVVSFEPLHNGAYDLREEVSAIMMDLDFQMIRYDTMRQTKEIRELLVARALYTTCLEPEHEEPDPEEARSDSWREDIQGIFSSWAAEETE